MKRAFGVLGLLAVVAGSASAQQPDPLSTRLRTFTDTPIATFQGADCVTIAAPKSVVWPLLVGPETLSGTTFCALAGEDVLSIDATTREGPRRIDLSVIAYQPGELLSFLLKSDDADLLDAKVESLTLSFFVDGRPDGSTDLTWASHFDADSPFSALLSPTYAKGRRARRLSALNLFKAIAEEAAILQFPPLHDVPITPQPTSAPKKRK